MASISSWMVEMKGFGGNFKMERKGREKMNGSQKSRWMPLIIIKMMKNKEGLEFLLGQENNFI